MRTLIILLSLAVTTFSWSQYALYEQVGELASLLDSLRSARTDEDKMAKHEAFKALLRTTLEDPAAFTYDFSALKTVGVIDSPDNKVRIITWNVEQADQSQIYGGFVLKMDDRRPEHKVIELVDNSYMIEYRSDEVLGADNWYGALYYKIIPVEKGNKTYYTLLGWDGATNISNFKLIDVLYFTGNNAKLGYQLFKDSGPNKRRIYMEYSEQTVMSLKWEADSKRIMFDHLSPETPALEGFYQYYVPDMTYDAYEFNGAKWVLIEDVIGLNKDQEVVHVNQIDPKTGEVTEKEADNKWVDPTSAGSPVAKEVHIAVTSEDPLENDAKKSDKSAKGDPKTALDNYENGRKKDKRDPSDSYLRGKKSKKNRKK